MIFKIIILMVLLMVPNYKINSKTLDSLNDTNLYDVSEDYMFSFENQQTIREKLIKNMEKTT